MRTTHISRQILAPVALCCALVASTVTCGASAAQHHSYAANLSTMSARLDAYFRQLVRGRAFRGAVLIAQGGTIILSRGYDAADRGRGVANTPRTEFRIGSLTEQFTAAAILQLQDGGKLRVTDRICSYMAHCPKAWNPITVEELLVGTAGIPDYLYSSDPTALSTPSSPADLLAALTRRPLDFAPGTRVGSATSNYLILGFIIEKVSRQPYDVYIHDHILKLLGLSRTGYDQARPHLPEHASGYVSWDRVSSVAISPQTLYASGALYSSTEDLFRWDQVLRTGKFLSRKSAAAMFAVHKAYCPPGCPTGQTMGGAGYAWDISTQGQTRILAWGGFLPGFVSVNEVYPDRNITIVILANLNSVNVRTVTRACQAILFGRR